jgi:hypothetical protein
LNYSGLKKLSHAPYIDFEAALTYKRHEGVGLDPDSRRGKLSEFILT